ncbi:peptide chain release factor 2, partial [Rhizobium ruizarguesonis]
MNPDVSQDLEDLNSTLTTIEKVVNVDDLKDQVRELEVQ